MADPIEINLAGCRAEPLMSYLTALGVLRLVASQADSNARAFWHSGSLHLQSNLSEDGMVDFFLRRYQPTPIIAPWNGSSGFYAKGNRQAIRAITGSTSTRFASYRDVINLASGLLRELDLSDKKPTKQQKQRLLHLCRQTFPDDAVEWLDTACLLTPENPAYPPILGTGANDGRLEFTNNFMQRLVDVLPLDDEMGPPPLSQGWLEAALFGEPGNNLVRAAIGQFHPGGVGGPNATVGFVADSLVNPWGFVFTIEGTLLLAGSISRRMGTQGVGRASFPFTVGASAAGSGTLVGAESGTSSRGELWLPIWNRSVRLGELKLLFSEGRAEIGRRRARNGVDFARAVATLGVDRGISSFTRYCFLRRSGRAFLASPLGRIKVVKKQYGNLLLEMDPWLESLRRACRSENVPASLSSSLRRLENAIFEFCLRGGQVRLQAILIALGKAEKVLATGARPEEKVRRPFYHLSTRWLGAADDGSPEFRLAASLASIWHKDIGSFRMNLEPVAWKRNRFEWSEVSHSVKWREGSLVRSLEAILERRIVEAGQKDTKTLLLGGFIPTNLSDLDSFITGKVEDQRISDLLWGLASLRWRGIRVPWATYAPRPPAFSRCYGLLKMLFLSEPLRWGASQVAPPVDTQVLSRLRQGNIGSARRLAVRRLRASGLSPLADDFGVPDQAASRMEAALLFPITRNDMFNLAKLVLRPPTVEVASET